MTPLGLQDLMTISLLLLDSILVNYEHQAVLFCALGQNDLYFTAWVIFSIVDVCLDCNNQVVLYFTK